MTSGSGQKRLVGQRGETEAAAPKRPTHGENSSDLLRRLERTIGARTQTFVDVGQALHVVNEQRLYRILGYPSFADYLKRRWGMSRGYAYRKMAAARVVETLSSAGRAAFPQMRRKHASSPRWLENQTH